MREFFRPGIALLMHQRNKVKMPLAGVLFSLPLLILILERSIAWSSPAGIAIGVTYLLAWYYIGALYFTSDISWAAVHQMAKRLHEHDLRRDPELATEKMLHQFGSGQFGQDSISTARTPYRGAQPVPVRPAPDRGARS